MEVYVLYGLTEEMDCYSLSTFGNAFLDFQKALKEGKERLKIILEEHPFHKDQELNITEEEDYYSVFLYQENAVRFELEISKITLSDNCMVVSKEEKKLIESIRLLEESPSSFMEAYIYDQQQLIERAELIGQEDKERKEKVLLSQTLLSKI